MLPHPSTSASKLLWLLGLASYYWLCGALGSAAEEAAAEKTTYDDHVRPIFRQHCLTCHNADSKKGDLSLDSYAAVLSGGASGEVVLPGDLESSRLWGLVSHQEEPAMPPDADRLPEEKLALVRKWIEGGALENRGSVAKVRPSNGLTMVASAAQGQPTGPAAIPEALLCEPLVATDRAAAVTALAASPWAPLIAVAGQRQVVLYHSDTRQLLGILPFPEGVPQVLGFSRDGSLLLVAGGQGATLGLAALYDVRSGSRLVTVGDEYDTVLAASVSADRSLIALGGPQKVVRVFSTHDGSLAYELRKHTDWVTAVAFSPDGKLLLSSDRNGSALLWEAETGREVAALRGHVGEVTAAAWRADSQVLATAGVDGTIRLWNPNEGNQIKSWLAHGGGATSVCFAADGRLVSAGRDRVVKLWKPDGGHLRDLATLSDIVLASCITHAGRRIAAGDFSGEVRLLDAENGQPLGQLPPNPPTLATRVAAATAEIQLASVELKQATAARLESQQGLELVQAESASRGEALAAQQALLSEAQTARQAITVRLTTAEQAIATAGEQISQTASALSLAATAVQTAQAELAEQRAAGADTATTETKLTAATEQTTQVIAEIKLAYTAMATAQSARGSAAQELAAVDSGMTVSDQGLQQAQSAVDEVAGRLTTLQETVSQHGQEITTHEATLARAQQTLKWAQAEQARFAGAKARFEAAIASADSRAAAQFAAVTAAQASEQQAAGELAALQSVAAAGAKKLAAAQAEYQRLHQAVIDAQAIREQLANAHQQAAESHHHETAAAAQARADKELFEKSQQVQEAYGK